MTDTRVRTWSHEVRLSNEERIGGFLDYIVGYFNYETHSPTISVINRPISLVPAFAVTTINRQNFEREEAFFGNLTAHIGERTELSGGVRHITYKKDASTLVTPATVPTPQNERAKTWIWTGSLKHNWSDDFMTYATVGTSWRPPTTVVGVEGSANPQRIIDFSQLQPEKSQSYEAGFKDRGDLGFPFFRRCDSSWGWIALY